MSTAKTPALSPFAGFLQIAYVTTDLTRAIAHFALRHNGRHQCSSKIAIEAGIND